MKDNMNPDRNKHDGGSHPVGTGVGAAGGALTGAAVGSAVGGPVGTVVGGVVGAVAGGMAGRGVAEAMDPAAEEAHWRQNYSKSNYFESGRDYSDYGPAYKYGWESRGRMGNRKFDEVENDLAKGWNGVKGESKLAWEKAKHATRDAWHRVERALPGDADGDGY